MKKSLAETCTEFVLVAHMTLFAFEKVLKLGAKLMVVLMLRDQKYWM